MSKYRLTGRREDEEDKCYQRTAQINAKLQMNATTKEKSSRGIRAYTEAVIRTGKFS